MASILLVTLEELMQGIVGPDQVMHTHMDREVTIQCREDCHHCAIHYALLSCLMSEATLEWTYSGPSHIPRHWDSPKHPAMWNSYSLVWDQHCISHTEFIKGLMVLLPSSG